MRCSLSLTLMLLIAAAHGQVAPPPPDPLPDSPGTLAAQQQSVMVLAKATEAATKTSPMPCHTSIWWHFGTNKSSASSGDQDTIDRNQARIGCINPLNPYARFLDTTIPIPMTPRQKGYLAIHNLTDPFNLGTIVASSTFGIVIDSHSAYGPGIGGIGLSIGTSLLQDATGEFFGTFLIPSVTHEDPHYHRIPSASIPHRLVHAVSRTVIAQHDDGTLMPNYAVLLGYPIAAEISNLYVPGIQSNAPSTTKRVLVGYATDPVGNIITEFLPDVAKRIHIRIIFVQRILNQVATTPSGTQP